MIQLDARASDSEGSGLAGTILLSTVAADHCPKCSALWRRLGANSLGPWGRTRHAQLCTPLLRCPFQGHTEYISPILRYEYMSIPRLLEALLSMPSPHPSDKTAKVFGTASQRAKITAVQISLSKNGHDDQSDAPDFPDGGLTAWGTVLGAFLIQFCGFGYNSFTLCEQMVKKTQLVPDIPALTASIKAR
ncbi:hypothetical protein K503DRAFT_859898 [Rhizopogon vinicolor AM-OR11-026]|uniref:Uncharacterized protein n=1 Tax=Rhizopogon vinicolor AM-OR11-026 TaxID=1314800 RepID=A0A1B7MKW4_9AGAM|nr:hypothetical protein K503DRAFT_859898 [Rhizopogon vinicolor AM-OR11-026]